MNKLSDEKILSCLRSTNKREKDQGLKGLYGQYYSVIAGFVARNNGSEEDAADIFQDAIIVFYEKIRLNELELKCTIQTYLYSICKNLWLNRLRSKKKIVNLNDDMESIPIPEESLSILETSDQQKTLMQLINTLGEDCKKVLTHYYFERLRMKEIAQLMGLANEQVAKNKKSGCLKKLRALVLDVPGMQSMLR